ncbi:MAG TPA: HPr family phosphocarrier protein [Pseudomonadales bacterium]
MQRRSVIIINKLGLHARAASKLVATASSFESKVLISRDEKLIDGKSIMAVLMLAATKGTELEIITDGHDEEEAALALITLINNRFDEEA